jgi:hypothetical protein
MNTKGRPGMPEKERADKIGVGGYFAPYVFKVTPEFNQQR